MTYKRDLNKGHDFIRSIFVANIDNCGNLGFVVADAVEDRPVIISVLLPSIIFSVGLVFPLVASFNDESRISRSTSSTIYHKTKH